MILSVETRPRYVQCNARYACSLCKTAGTKVRVAGAISRRQELLRELGWYQESTLNEGIDDSESGASRIAEVQTTRDDALK